MYKEAVDELNRSAVRFLVKKIKELLASQEHIVLAIPGGRSVRSIWNILAEETHIDWSRIHIFMADERVVPPDHDDSNFKLAFDTFLKQVVADGLAVENTHPFIPNDTADRGASDYFKQLQQFGGPDILILSSGEDGHVGALYPNHHSIRNAKEGYIFMDDSPKPPAERITMSRKTMLKAKVALLLFVGESKQEAYKKFLEEGNVVKCPARLVRQIGDSYVLTNLKP